MRYLLLSLLPSLAFAQGPTPRSSDYFALQLPPNLAQAVEANAKCAAFPPEKCANCCKAVPSPATPVAATDKLKIFDALAPRDGESSIFVTSGPAVSAQTVSAAPRHATQTRVEDVLALAKTTNPIATCLASCPGKGTAK